MAVDAFTLEIIHRSLVGVAREMKVTTMRTAYTQLWKEQGDLSCCLMDAEGQIIAQDPLGFPVHMTTMPHQLDGLLHKLGRDDLEPGDVLITNDPYLGSTHLPDVLIARPLFWEDDLYGFACNRGHWADIGGMGPGSYSPSTSEIFQEGLLIPPVKLFSAGELDAGVLELIVANVRDQRNVHGDLRAQYASCHTAQRRLEDIVERNGLETVKTSMAEIVERSESFARARISEFAEGNYHVQDVLDGDGSNDELVLIDLKLTIKGDEILVDLQGCSPQSKGGMNCSHAASVSAVQYAVKCFTDPENAPNAGSYRPVKLKTKPGTVVDALPPAAMVGYGEVVYRVMDATFAALSDAMPDKAVAAGSGSTGTVVVAGRRDDEDSGEYFNAIELSSGASGAFKGGDGHNAMRYGAGNAGHIPIEADEIENPFLFERYEILPNTGGAGEFRGGNGFCRVFRVTTDQASITVCADRHISRPPGLFGGCPGTAARYVLNPGTEREKVLSSKTPYIPLERGTLVWLQSAGGGGLGDPKRRDRSKVRWDLKNGYITDETAREAYGMC
jgi:N-methylhydantoinase B